MGQVGIVSAFTTGKYGVQGGQEGSGQPRPVLKLVLALARACVHAWYLEG